ncbi:MAG: glycine--tRNA ligase subunit beta [Elusimicrobia bacterium]|nr:glycine--tRNA ligase subunit beta [Elusimicrobiota bacterium]
MKRKDFVLEIGVEPLPARFVRPALEALAEGSTAMLKGARLDCAAVRVLGTMRRLVLILDELADRTESLAREVQGPPARLLKDAEGRFTPQAEGFARKHGVRPSELLTVPTPKGEFLAARVTEEGLSALAILGRELPALIGGLKFAKAMEWERTRFSFGRPIRGLLALHGSKVVGFELAGVKSGRAVLAAPGSRAKPVRIADAGRYLSALRNMAVVVDPEERRSLLMKRMNACAKGAGGILDSDEALLEETVFMTEHPVPVAGQFRKEFLELPEGLIKTVLKGQLYAFPLTTKAGLCPAFVAVRDGASEGQKEVREGFEGVLEARLDDAAFYLSRDLKTRLEDKLPALGRVSFQKGLGSMADKAARVREVTLWICSQLSGGAAPVALDQGIAEAIARLAYADLACEVIREFPELQGAMGGFYARRNGLDERVASGIAEFYQPLGPSAPVPCALEGALAAMAGKLDNLACHFAIGNIPTAAADPYALRRSALGVLRILAEKGLRLDLTSALGFAMSLVPAAPPGDRPPAANIFPDGGRGRSGSALDRAQALAALKEFVMGRAASFFEEAGFGPDAVRSVRDSALRSIPSAMERLKAVEEMRSDPRFADLCQAFKRASNILRSSKPDQDGGLGGSDRLSAVALRGALKEPAEIALLDALERIEADVAAATSEHDYLAALRVLASMKAPLDRFFEDVLVMADDPVVRRSRLALLARMVRCFKSVADLAEIAGPR